MPCFEGTIIFCPRLKIHREISLKKVTLKGGCLKCNVSKTLSSTHTFKVSRAHQSIFLLGTKGILKVFFRYIWTPLLSILTFKSGLKMLILVSERNVCNMESPIAFDTQLKIFPTDRIFYLIRFCRKPITQVEIKLLCVEWKQQEDKWI